MRTRLVLAAGALTVVAAGTVPAMAAGNGNSGPTVGDCVSDGFYGNEPNMADGTAGGPAEQDPGTQAGNVLASQSPGPFKTLPNGSVVRGSSIGDYQRGTDPAGLVLNIPLLCKAAVGH
jgi:hypothetical protein